MEGAADSTHADKAMHRTSSEAAELEELEQSDGTAQPSSQQSLTQSSHHVQHDTAESKQFELSSTAPDMGDVLETGWSAADDRAELEAPDTAQHEHQGPEVLEEFVEMAASQRDGSLSPEQQAVGSWQFCHHCGKQAQVDDISNFNTDSEHSRPCAHFVLSNV